MASHVNKRSNLPEVAEIDFSFKVSHATNAPTIVRDGKGAQVASISALTASVYTVTLDTADTSPGIVLPRQITSAVVCTARALDTTDVCTFDYVADSYVPQSGSTAASFKLQARTVSTGAPLASATVNAWVSVRLCGPIIDDNKDAA